MKTTFAAALTLTWVNAAGQTTRTGHECNASDDTTLWMIDICVKMNFFFTLECA